MTRRDDSRVETRKLILQAAQNLFWEKGADNCTIRSIAKEAGVSPASVIVHFKNKTALLEVVLYEDIEKTLSKAQETLPSEKGLHAVLMHMLSGMLSLYDKNRELYRILVRDTLFEPIHKSPYIAKLDDEYFNFLVSLLDHEKKIGTVRLEVDSLLAASSFFSLYIGVLRDFLRDPELSVPQALERLSATFEQYLVGILIVGANQ